MKPQASSSSSASPPLSGYKALLDGAPLPPRAAQPVLRLWNHDALTKTEAVLAQIWNALHDRTLSPIPLPPGEGLSREPLP
jgi:hypothetical protein